MNIIEIKKRIYALMDIPGMENESALLSAIDSAAKKIALYAKCIKKSEKICFVAENGVFSALLPADFASFCYVKQGMRVYGRENFEIIGRKIKSTDKSGECELVYCAYPPAVNEETAEATVIFEDGFAADTVAFGAAMELCASLCPTDVQRYMRIATEYDERMANMISDAGRGVANKLFSGTRGVFI